MSKRILIIDGHPDSQTGRYIHALAKAYFDGARMPIVTMMRALRPLSSLVGKPCPLTSANANLPALFYRWYFRAHSLKSLQRNILRFCGFRPVNACVIGMIECMSQAQRGEWLARVQDLGVKGR
jgi:putative NADPH-quinone reductase